MSRREGGWEFLHSRTPSCDLFRCAYIVEQHQGIEPEVTAPEFTIAVSYQPGAPKGYPFADMPSLQSGWKWSICWTDAKGRRKMRTGYGFPTPKAAKVAAEDKAQQMALAEQPEEVYTYRPSP